MQKFRNTLCGYVKISVVQRSFLSEEKVKSPKGLRV